MKIAIMQPYFFPYIGYFQLIAAVDLFIVYDNIKYTKKGWINRNRMLLNGKDAMFSLALKNDSDALDVCDRELAADFDRDKLINKIGNAYRHAPHFSTVFPLIERIIRYQEHNLFRYIYHSLTAICGHLGIKTDIRISSAIAIDHELKNQAKVLALCEAVGATSYINTIGGTELYSKDEFQQRGISLQFIRSRPFEYAQFENEFVPWLSVIDVMMFNPIARIRECIESNYDLI
jgi:hypothetical protein